MFASELSMLSFPLYAGRMHLVVYEDTVSFFAGTLLSTFSLNLKEYPDWLKLRKNILGNDLQNDGEEFWVKQHTTTRRERWGKIYSTCPLGEFFLWIQLIYFRNWINTLHIVK